MPRLSVLWTGIVAPRRASDAPLACADTAGSRSLARADASWAGTRRFSSMLCIYIHTLVWVLALGTRCYLKIGATFSSQLSCHRTLCEHEQGRHVASTATYACIRRTSDSATPSRRRDNSEPSPGDTGWRFSNVCSCCASSCGVVNVKPLLERTHQPTMSYTSDNGVNTARRTGYAEPTRRCS